MKAYRKDGVIVVEMPEKDILSGVSQHPDGYFKVTDKESFLKFLTENLLDAGELKRGDSYITTLLDHLTEEAFELGHGIEENQNYN